MGDIGKKGVEDIPWEDEYEDNDEVEDEEDEEEDGEDMFIYLINEDDLKYITKYFLMFLKFSFRLCRLPLEYIL